MENDITILFCDLYFDLTNKNIYITLINGKELYGYINGYYYDDIDADYKKISIWHFVENHNNTIGKEFIYNKLIPHKIIKQIKYFNKNLVSQTIKFNH